MEISLLRTQSRFARSFAAMMAGCLCGCNATKEADNNNKMKIVTTIFPEYDWVNNILGDNASNADATQCCAQGIEFVPADEYTYPDDFPQVGEDICVAGVFDTYMEGNGRYLTLRDARLLPLTAE